MKTRVGIVFGGQSAEHEISILSARNVLEALDRARFEPVLIGIDKAAHWLIQTEQRLLGGARDPRLVRMDSGPPVQPASPLAVQATNTLGGAGRIDVIFPVLHGTLGEDGAAFEFDSKVLAETAISGREIELAVLGGNPASASVPGEIIVQHPDGFYSYDAKYLDEHGATLEIPARMPAKQCAAAQALALYAFEVLECEGMARVDLFLQADDALLVNEINTIPGFTAISMYPKLWALSGVTPTELVTRLIDLALQRAERRAAIRRSLDP